MSLFGLIKDKVFGHEAKSAEPAKPGEAQQTAAAPADADKAAGAAPPAIIDVEAVLTDLSTKAGQQLDWRHSIVDLMKLLDLDSGLGARKELAKELGYSGDSNDSASMNIWLHKQVMRKFAESGGRVPEDLKA
jgi:hypothetical protein